jgi:Spy/CpxP family protein refolding chaperone
MTQVVAAIVFAVVAAMPAAAQNRSNFAWWNSAVVSDLNLSDAQRKQIHDTVSSYRPKLIDARAEMRKAQGELQDLLNSEHVDPAQAAPVVDKLAKAQAESTRVFTEMSLRLREVLTLDQWRELVKRWGALQRGRRPADPQAQP